MKRPRQHVMEEESEQLLKRLLPSNWLIRNIEKDYGVDYEIEIVEGTRVTGMRLWVQLKAQESYKTKIINFGTNAVNFFTYQLPTKNAKYALNCGFPLLLFLADLKNESICYVSIRDEIAESICSKKIDWYDQKTISIKIPAKNNLAEDKKGNFYDMKWFAGEPLLLGKLNLLSFFSKQFEYNQKFDVVEWCSNNSMDEYSLGCLIETFEMIKKIIDNVKILDERFSRFDISPNPFSSIAYNNALSYTAAQEGLVLAKLKNFKYSELMDRARNSQIAIRGYSSAFDLYLMHKKGFLLCAERFEY